MLAHRELVRTWSSGDASLAAWSEYYQHSASLYEQIAEIDPAHELEALYWARREHIARSRSRPGRRRAATKVATVGDHEKLTRYGATRHTGNTLAGETGGRCAKGWSAWDTAQRCRRMGRSGSGADRCGVQSRLSRSVVRRRRFCGMSRVRSAVSVSLIGRRCRWSRTG
jgi:hypothetical protein